MDGLRLIPGPSGAKRRGLNRWRAARSATCWGACLSLALRQHG